MPAQAQAAAEEIKQELFSRFNLRGALRSPAHITLHRPFEWPDKKENKLIAALEAFRYTVPFSIKILNFNFFEPRVIYADVMPEAGLSALHEALSQHCRLNLGLLNEAADLRGFHPHVTLAFRDLKKPLFYQLRQEFEKRTISLEFEYSGFSLLRLESTWKEYKVFKQI